MIYGYKLADTNDVGLLELKELTFSASPQVLREISTFLSSMADLMEDGSFNHSHRHIGSCIGDWDRRFPDKDIIVASPA